MGVFRNANQRTVHEHGSGRRVGRTRAVLAALGLVLAAVPFMASTPASGAGFTPARSAGVNSGGFPLWFQDANGVRAELCLDPADTNCLAPLSGPGYDQNLPLSFPTNYPDEVFYSAVDSQPITANDLACSPGAGTIDVHMALEAAFFNGAPAVGDQAVFGRIRMNADPGSGLCGSTWYTFKTPYGPVTLQTEPDGALLGGAAAAATIDIGCFPTPTVPCAFNETLTAPVLQIGFLQQAAGAPQGYLGNGSFGAVTGGLAGFNQVEIYKWPEGATPGDTGYDAPCVGDCTLVGSTSNFAVLTKLAGPISPSTEAYDFGGQVVTPAAAATSAPIDLTNVGSGALGLDPTAIDDIVVTGAGFGLGSTSCSIGTVTSPDPAVALARDASCWVTVTFEPGVTGPAVGTLEIYSAGNPVPEVVQLAGTGINAGDAPTIDLSVTNLSFLDVRLRTVSDIQTVTITNAGTAPLLLQPSIDGLDAAAFGILGNSCPSGFVPALGTCTIEVRFVPSVAGISSANLNLHTNIGEFGVALEGSAYGGKAAVSTTTDPINTFPDWYQDENGTRVGQCVQPTNPLCVTAPVVGALSFPDNYPDEWFYYVANSAPLEIADPACDAAPGSIMVETAAEAAFLGAIAPNEGITFGRLRIVAHGGLCPNTEYMLTHPYGRIAIITNENGDIKPNMGTTDIGCTTLPCDYTQALSSPVLESFLEQTVRPGGWLGDPLQPSTVIGAPFDDPFTGLPANHFYVQPYELRDVQSSIIAYTDQFTVSGRLVGPIVATPGAITFGAAEAGVPLDATPASVTYANSGIDPVVLDATTPVTVEGNRAAEFTIDGTTCAAGATLNPGDSCTVDLRFAPMGTGNRDAAVVLHHSGKNSPTEVPLTGIGLAPAGSAAFSAVRDTVQFIDLHVLDAINPVGSESQQVVISNVGGQASLEVLDASVPVGADYVITSNTCVGVLVVPGDTCTIGVRFTPNAAGNRDAALTVTGQTFTGIGEVPGTLDDVVVALKGNGVVTEPALSATSTNGFFNWIQDRNGVRLEQCLVTDGNCVLLADATFNPGQPVSFPTNYPSESFYSFVDSELVSFGPQVCGDGSTSGGGTALLRIVTEAAFTSPQPQAGTQNLFNRIRLTADGLCANTTYSIVTPYGLRSVTTDGTGSVIPRAGTFDNTDITGTEPVSRSFLQWDPNVGAKAPAGYLGSPNVFHKVVGSQYIPVGATEPANYFAILGGAGEVVRTELFSVSGRLAGPVVTSLTSKDFGVVEGGGHSTSQTFTITNIGSAPIGNLVVSTSGLDAAQFTIQSQTCTAAGTLVRDAHCEIVVTFDPAVVATQTVRNATLTFSHDGLRSPINIALTGRANPPLTPALTVSPTSFAFTATNVGSTASTLITVRNPGTGALTLDAMALVSPDFSITANTCPVGTATLNAGVSCQVTVRFNPASRGAKSGSFSVHAVDAVGVDGHTTVVMPAVTVNLTGTATQPTVTVSPAATLNISGQAGRPQTGRVTITNTGTGNFSLQSPVPGQAAIQFVAVSANTPLPRFSANHNCTNIIPGKSCTVTVSFTAGTLPIGTTWSVDMKLFGNASNLGGSLNPYTVRVNGTRNK